MKTGAVRDTASDLGVGGGRVGCCRREATRRRAWSQGDKVYSLSDCPISGGVWGLSLAGKQQPTCHVAGPT
jgi:hypothetical protein